MCLRTEQIEPQIATEDITCYKVIRKDMSSLYYDEFKWKFNKVYTSWIATFERTKNVDHAIYQAFHSYESLEGLKKEYYMATVPCIAVKCTIPKGSEYYLGRQGEMDGYASNKLIANEVIDVKELYPDFDWDNYPYKEGQVIQVKKPHDKSTWKDYQITNIQPHPINNIFVDLIVKDCRAEYFADTIKTMFDGKVWQSKNCVISSKSKEE